MRGLKYHLLEHILSRIKSRKKYMRIMWWKSDEDFLIRSQTWRCICLSVLKRLVLAVQGQAAKCRRRRNLSGAATKALRFTLAPHSNKCLWPVPQVQSNLENFGNTWVTGILGNQEFQWLCVFKNFLGGPCVGKQEKMRGWPSWYLAVTDLGDGGRELRLGMVKKDGRRGWTPWAWGQSYW